LAENKIPIYSITKAWHLPMGIKNGLDFSKVVKEAYDSATIINYPLINTQDDPFDVNSMELFEKNFRGYFSISLTKKDVSLFYKTLLSKVTWNINDKENENFISKDETKNENIKNENTKNENTRLFPNIIEIDGETYNENVMIDKYINDYIDIFTN
jgi:hypothetical protein